MASWQARVFISHPKLGSLDRPALAAKEKKRIARSAERARALWALKRGRERGSGLVEASLPAYKSYRQGAAASGDHERCGVDYWWSQKRLCVFPHTEAAERTPCIPGVLFSFSGERNNTEL